MRRCLLTPMIVLAAVGMCLPGGVAAGPSDAVRVQRIEPGGESPWSVRLDPCTAAAGAPLAAEAWFPRWPEASLDPVEPGETAPSEPRGSVSLIDFWASWCEPCRVELPHLDAIRERLSPRGLRVIAVNVDDPPDVVRAFAEELGLSVELASASEQLQRAIRPKSLPTLLLVDEQGRIRSRWDGYRPGLEQEVEQAASALLAGSGVPEDRVLATVQDGDGAFRVRWARDLGDTVSGVTVQPTSSGARVLAATGGDLVALRDDGGNAGRAPAPQGTGRVRLEDVTGDGKADLIGWRRGSTTVGVLDLSERAATSWASEAPVFGLAVAPADHVRPEPTLVLATTAGLRYHAADGAIVARGDDHARDVDVEREATSASGASTAFLDADGRLVRVGRNGESVSTRAVSDDPRRLVLDAGDSIVASGVETDLFVPYRVDGDRPLAAVTSGACLHVLDAATGEPIWRAAWTEPIEQVAAGDLDQDGIAELIVASGDSVVVLDRSIVTKK